LKDMPDMQLVKQQKSAERVFELTST
jgi:hypothetical protein